MQVTVIRPFLNDSRVETEGNIIDVSAVRAKELEENGLIVPIVGGMHVVGRTTVKKATERTGVPASAVDPTIALPTGGLTGEDKPALSSEEDQPRIKRAYRRRKAAPE